VATAINGSKPTIERKRTFSGTPPGATTTS